MEGERERPRGWRVGVVRVCVFVRICDGDGSVGRESGGLEDGGKGWGEGMGMAVVKKRSNWYAERGAGSIRKRGERSRHTLATTSCTSANSISDPEYPFAACAISSIVCHVDSPSPFFWPWACWARKSERWDCRARKAESSVLEEGSFFFAFAERRRMRMAARTVFGRTLG